MEYKWPTKLQVKIQLLLSLYTLKFPYVSVTFTYRIAPICYLMTLMISLNNYPSLLFFSAILTAVTKFGELTTPMPEAERWKNY
jgi:hypothetical protein